MPDLNKFSFASAQALFDNNHNLTPEGWEAWRGLHKDLASKEEALSRAKADYDLSVEEVAHARNKLLSLT